MAGARVADPRPRTASHPAPAAMKDPAATPLGGSTQQVASANWAAD
jgi:hypothetical protein